MRALGNPLGNPVQGADGGQGAAKIGDIVFAAKAPNPNFIPITRRRVYRDQYPRLADVLLTQRENDGGEWLRPGGIFPGSFDSASRVPCLSGVSGGKNILLLAGTSPGNSCAVLRGSPTEKVFSEIATAASALSGPSIWGAVSEKGTIVAVCYLSPSSGNGSASVVRSVDGLVTATSVDVQSAGLGAVTQYSTARCFVLSLGNDRWLVITGNGAVYRSDDDGVNWRLVRSPIMSKGYNNGDGSYVGDAAINAVVDACIVGGRVYFLSQASENVGSTRYYTSLFWSNDLFTTYGECAVRNPTMDTQNLAMGVIGTDLVILQWTRTATERAQNKNDMPLRGAYFASGDTSLSNPVRFEVDGTQGAVYTGGLRPVAFTWDGYAYFGIPTYGLYKIEPRTFVKTKVSPTADGIKEGQFGPASFALFPTFALCQSYDYENYAQRASRALQAVPAASARQFYQFSDAGVVGAQRNDGKLPFMRAR